MLSNFPLQELTRIYSLSSLAVVTSIRSFLRLYIILPMTVFLVKGSAKKPQDSLPKRIPVWSNFLMQELTGIFILSSPALNLRNRLYPSVFHPSLYLLCTQDASRAKSHRSASASLSIYIIETSCWRNTLSLL